ncbi:hypothetical protein E2C01_085439 [Portunus trituberculatus]|uniref:Secreted protein n=1 Tax=Portunus trituberculatus TaxID=210409 RepID=A0A5B7J0Z7_PORTR|nr:hypothetical protein [Portunus trituberculatus]
MKYRITPLYLLLWRLSALGSVIAATDPSVPKRGGNSSSRPTSLMRRRVSLGVSDAIRRSFNTGYNTSRGSAFIARTCPPSCEPQPPPPPATRVPHSSSGGVGVSIW